jgi:Protein of unknown function (DUF1153)
LSNAWLATLPELIAEAAARGPAAIRWTAFRKELVVKAIHSRQLSHDVALTVFGLSDEELRSWEARYLAYGARGLKATRIQDYRAPAATDLPIGVAG